MAAAHYNSSSPLHCAFLIFRSTTMTLHALKVFSSSSRKIFKPQSVSESVGSLLRGSFSFSFWVVSASECFRHFFDGVFSSFLFLSHPPSLEGRRDVRNVTEGRSKEGFQVWYQYYRTPSFLCPHRSTRFSGAILERESLPFPFQ